MQFELTREEVLTIFSALTRQILNQEENLKDWESGDMYSHATKEKIESTIHFYKNDIKKLTELRDRFR